MLVKVVIADVLYNLPEEEATGIQKPEALLRSPEESHSQELPSRHQKDDMSHVPRASSFPILPGIQPFWKTSRSPEEKKKRKRKKNGQLQVRIPRSRPGFGELEASEAKL